MYHAQYSVSKKKIEKEPHFWLQILKIKKRY